MEKKKTGRQVTVYLVVNWKTLEVRALKRIPRRLGSYDIPVKVNLNLIIPKRTELEVNADIKLSQAQVSNIAVASLEDAFGSPRKEV
ncbi:MAG: hypothetical protein ACTSYX_09500 [Candidatus Thorarchaeota archaeon]